MLKELKVFLPLAEKVRARNPTLTILNYIAVHDGRMIITDLNHWLSIPVEDERDYTVPYDVIKQVMKSRPSSLDIDIQSNNNLEIHYDQNTVGCQCTDIEEYPSLPKGKFKMIGTWTGAMIMQIHKQLQHASTDELKPALQGVWIKHEKGTCQSCTTDGHTLEYISDLDPDQKAVINADFEGIVSPKCLQILTKVRIDQIRVAADDNLIQFYLPHYMILTSRLIDEHYPDFKAILKQDKRCQLLVNKKAVLKAIEASIPFMNKETCLSRLVLQNGSIGLFTTDHERNLSFETSIEHNGHAKEAIEVGFNLKLLQKTLKSIPGEDIVWKYRDNHSANLFVASDDNRKINLIMPVRLEEE